MTALRKYQRLESSGLWRETPEARLQEVLVALRSTTLILADPKTEIPLTQWSLPALRRLNPAQLPAVYAVADDKGETLEMNSSGGVPRPDACADLCWAAPRRFCLPWRCSGCPDR